MCLFVNQCGGGGGVLAVLFFFTQSLCCGEHFGVHNMAGTNKQHPFPHILICSGQLNRSHSFALACCNQ